MTNQLISNVMQRRKKIKTCGNFKPEINKWMVNAINNKACTSRRNKKKTAEMEQILSLLLPYISL